MPGSEIDLKRVDNFIDLVVGGEASACRFHGPVVDAFHLAVVEAVPHGSDGYSRLADHSGLLADFAQSGPEIRLSLVELAFGKCPIAVAVTMNEEYLDFGSGGAPDDATGRQDFFDQRQPR